MKAVKKQLRAMRFAVPIHGTPRVEPCRLTSLTTVVMGQTTENKKAK